MRLPTLILVMLWVACFSLATCLQALRSKGDPAEAGSDDVLVLLLGDGRKMFAREFFAKADTYFHRGNYPSMFDVSTGKEEDHMTTEAGHNSSAGSAEDHDKHDEGPPPAGDWIERFGQHFYPTVHEHLVGGEEREMLPWLRVSAALDPHRVETYAVSAYWLRDRLGKVDEAERFLRDGLRANPNDPELLFELGHLYFENRQDVTRARNLWLAALRRWKEVEASKEKPNLFLEEEILGSLVKLERQQGHLQEAIDYLKQLKQLSPNPGAIQAQIDDLNRILAQPPSSRPN